MTFTHKFPPTTGPFHKMIVAGHVGTEYFRSGDTNCVFHDGESHYFLDGGVETTGTLNILKYTVETQRYEAFSLA